VLLDLQAKNPCSNALLVAMDADDPVATGVRSRISDILTVNLAGPAALLESFAAVQQGLKSSEGDQGHLATWLVAEHSTQETAAEIDRLMEVSHTLVMHASWTLQVCQPPPLQLVVFLSFPGRCLRLHFVQPRPGGGWLTCL